MNAENSEDWIKHDGGPCPVQGNIKVDVKFADRSIENNFDADTWGYHFCSPDDWWKHEGQRANHIVAYRVVKP